ncbi:hypothetical protein KORDIASMS9_03826 [Kordia sp. SMS9]|uniref:hypothetical protein n=1 Tax=Kordia sp. SMS9 TaxID=2282170 RepID=UPI000E10254C|nr:hypothetical protein [Kordia sp. SMS9]AXG71569.1 hypothetical protein KORDIASMS9_03826 [Kordia sp. SMS9]
MKKKNLTSLSLNKRSISKIQGQGLHGGSSILTGLWNSCRAIECLSEDCTSIDCFVRESENPTCTSQN